MPVGLAWQLSSSPAPACGLTLRLPGATAQERLDAGATMGMAAARGAMMGITEGAWHMRRGRGADAAAPSMS